MHQLETLASAPHGEEITFVVGRLGLIKEVKSILIELGVLGDIYPSTREKQSIDFAK